MFKRLLLKWLVVRRAVRARHSLESGAEWKSEDAKNLAAFLRTESGKKLRGLLWEECAERAFGLRDVPVFERGVTAGMCAVGDTLDRMAVAEEVPEDEE